MPPKRIPLDRHGREIIEKQINAFRKKFGRDPSRDDPIFFDPDADTPQPYPEERFQADWNALLDKVVQDGSLRPELAYAARKTGFIVTEGNYHNLTEDELREWDDAIDEFLGRGGRGIH